MHIVGLIVEYNPLHNGHLYHFKQSKKLTGADAAVCVMSGHFLQRGEPAIVNKWARTEMALAMGADLVIELPAAFSSQPAEWFAYGAISALEATGIVDSLCFGSESGDIAWLGRAADAVFHEPEPFKALLKAALASGQPYPSAYSQALAQFVPGLEADALAQPNNTLGLHYLIALRRLSSRIEPFTIARTKAGYNQTAITDQQIASATALRELLASQNSLTALLPYVPSSTLDVLQREVEAGRAPLSWERFARPLLHQLLIQDASELAQYCEVSEGLEHRIKRAVTRLAQASELTGTGTAETLIGLLKTKRYTRTKLQRMLLHILLHHKKTELSSQTLRAGVPYSRILGFSKQGRILLNSMKKTAKVPVILKASSGASGMLALDIQASSIYALGYDTPPDERELFRDYFQPPVIHN